MLNIDVTRSKNILLKYIFDKADFEKLTECVTVFIETKKSVKDMEKYLKLIENEIAIPLDENGKFSLGIVSQSLNTKTFNFFNENESEQLSKANIWLNGLLPRKKETMIENYNFFVYCGISDKNGYKNLNNIFNEVLIILGDIDSEGKLRKFFDDINTDILDDLSGEFLNINNSRAKMFTSKRAILYSSLLNYSLEDIERSSLYDLAVNKINNWSLENWDEISLLLRKFLKEISTRTIHY